MALVKSSTGEYLKVYDLHVSNEQFHFTYKIFANSEQRQKYDKGLSPYEQFKEGFYHVSRKQQLINELADGKKSIVENMITAAYNELKLENEFKDWEDA